MDETRKLAAKCQEMKYEDLSEAETDRVKYLFLDYLGVAARGALYESSRPVRRLIRNSGGTKEGAVVVGTDLKAPPPFAALANGTASHAPELDDVVNEASLHPGVVVFSTALAASAASGCSGGDFMAAVVSGYDVTVRLAVSLDPSAPYSRGFHPTGTCGTMGAAVTAAKILQLDDGGMVHALGIAGSQAAGSMEFLANGAFTKRLHAGWAAHSGVMAALLAREGFSGPDTILEGKYGFLHSYADRSDANRILADWGDPYYIARTSIKPHSCCRYKQGPIDAVLKIMRQHDLEADDIEKVTLGILKAGFSLVGEPEDRKRRPVSVVDAQFSMPFGAAVAALHGQATLDQYTMENIDSDIVKRMMDRVQCVQDPDLDREFPIKWPAWASISMKNGRTHTERIEYPKGDPENPLTWKELTDKFRYLVSPVFTASKTEDIIRAVRSLDRDTDMNVFSELLSKG
ncbi:MAG: MmgE/PrpD family protein [Proteobacteria bacterium]|nr:MmgE/PrpD family protein [Pseudomonadota bacterium]